MSTSCMVYARSPLRSQEAQIPSIIAQWAGKSREKYTLKDSHLEAYPIFKVFDKHFFSSHLLPKGSISYRYNPKLSVSTKKLNHLIIQLLKEIQSNKRNYSHF